MQSYTEGGDALFIGKNQRSWDQYLQQLVGTLKASVNRSTGYTPNMMMLGKEISLPAELMFRSPEKTGQPEGDQYVGKLQTAIEGAHGVARETETGTETNEEGLRRKSKGQGIKTGGFGVPIGHCHH